MFSRRAALEVDFVRAIAARRYMDITEKLDATARMGDSAALDALRYIASGVEVSVALLKVGLVTKTAIDAAVLRQQEELQLQHYQQQSQRQYAPHPPPAQYGVFEDYNAHAPRDAPHATMPRWGGDDAALDAAVSSGSSSVGSQRKGLFPEVSSQASPPMYYDAMEPEQSGDYGSGSLMNLDAPVFVPGDADMRYSARPMPTAAALNPSARKDSDEASRGGGVLSWLGFSRPAPPTSSSAPLRPFQPTASRPASLRLDEGDQDIGMLLGGLLDTDDTNSPSFN
jgi:hypothetical protein